MVLSDQMHSQAAKVLEKLAEEEQLPDAQFNLACYYAQGIGVPVNPTVAFKWHKRAAEQGHVEAMAALIVAAGVARLPSALVLTRALDG